MPNQDKLKLSPHDFDQSPFGWREVKEKEGSEKAAQLILEYLAKNRSEIKSPQFLYFHAGQMLADIGKSKYQEATEMFRQSFMEDKECWNAYVSATIAFLAQDPVKIREAIKTIESSTTKETIESSTTKDKSSGNLEIVKNFLKALGQDATDYQAVYNLPR